MSQSEYRKFDQSLSNVDGAVHLAKIRMGRFSERLKGIVAIEEFQSDIKVYSLKGRLKHKVALNSKKARVFSLGVAFSDRQNLVRLVDVLPHILS